MLMYMCNQYNVYVFLYKGDSVLWASSAIVSSQSNDERTNALTVELLLMIYHYLPGTSDSAQDQLLYPLLFFCNALNLFWGHSMPFLLQPL